ncbi:hypothetical protein G3I60_13920 [Streptomyces sp. SID13666]|uniref:WXG100 family type VII secretion target n=1 Tax=unclassified Streptomyces TaxID=2593676 RepID=UPI0013C08D8D|nr:MULTISPECIES: hypothetical protein [unclassified Streptomyces]NEA55216.1 hypothetical protein [Streptomyces sp. SID13666]NEA76426.1 hypothetical protein [Streptomyces sp. SID13588]
MGHRPTDWHLLDLDGDPTPGDPDRVKTLATRLDDFADDVEGALRQVKGLQSEDAILQWAGLSAEAFRDEFDGVPGNLTKLHKSYRLAADALAAYWPELDHCQRQADKALSDGRTARAHLSTAQTNLNSANDWVRTAAAKADEYDPAKNPGKDIPKPDSDEVRQATRNASQATARHTECQTAVTTAQTALDAAKRLAEQARGMRENAAKRTVTKLHEASDAGIRNRHWWEKAVHWVADHWDEIVTVCKWIVAIAGIIVMIVGGPLAWLVVAAALVVLADTINKYVHGEASLWDVAFAVLDCIPMTKGLTSLGKLKELWKAGGLLKIGAHALGSIKNGLQGIANGVRAAAAGLRGGKVAVVSLAKGLSARGAKTLALEITGFKDGRPGMKLFAPGDQLRKYMDRIPHNGSFDVGIHGSPTSVGYQIKSGAAHLPENWHNFNHRELAALMKANGWNGEPVRLLSCSTGKVPNGFAQNLANHLGTTVEAPNDFLWVYPNGKIAVAPFDAAGKSIHPSIRGKYETFTPGNG